MNHTHSKPTLVPHRLSVVPDNSALPRTLEGRSPAVPPLDAICRSVRDSAVHQLRASVLRSAPAGPDEDGAFVLAVVESLRLVLPSLERTARRGQGWPADVARAAISSMRSLGRAAEPLEAATGGPVSRTRP